MPVNGFDLLRYLVGGDVVPFAGVVLAVLWRYVRRHHPVRGEMRQQHPPSNIWPAPGNANDYRQTLVQGSRRLRPPRDQQAAQRVRRTVDVIMGSVIARCELREMVNNRVHVWPQKRQPLKRPKETRVRMRRALHLIEKA